MTITNEQPGGKGRALKTRGRGFNTILGIEEM